MSTKEEKGMKKDGGVDGKEVVDEGKEEKKKKETVKGKGFLASLSDLVAPEVTEEAIRESKEKIQEEERIEEKKLQKEKK